MLNAQYNTSVASLRAPIINRERYPSASDPRRCLQSDAPGVTRTPTPFAVRRLLGLWGYV